MSLLGEFDKGRIFIVSAPAGTGKTTLVKMLTQEFPRIKQSISFTTRQKRPNEENGVHYQFISEEEFKQKVQENSFLEYAYVHGNYYGTSKIWVEEELNKGNHVVLVIDTQGALPLIEKMHMTSIFIKPPSLDKLRERLVYRSTDNLEEIERRIKWAEVELRAQPFYDYVITNDSLNISYDVLRSIFIAEGHKQLTNK